MPGGVTGRVSGLPGGRTGGGDVVSAGPRSTGGRCGGAPERRRRTGAGTVAARKSGARRRCARRRRARRRCAHRPCTRRLGAGRVVPRTRCSTPDCRWCGRRSRRRRTGRRPPRNCSRSARHTRPAGDSQAGNGAPRSPPARRAELRCQSSGPPSPPPFTVHRSAVLGRQVRPPRTRRDTRSTDPNAGPGVSLGSRWHRRGNFPRPSASFDAVSRRERFGSSTRRVYSLPLSTKTI